MAMTAPLPASPELTDEVLTQAARLVLEHLQHGTDEIEVIMSAPEPDSDRALAFNIARAVLSLRHRSSPSAEWPDFIAPQKYENAAPGWEDPRLPDFRLIWRTAREQGYAIGLHGSMKRDVDLIAAPWTDSAAPIETLISRLCAALDAREVGIREAKPQGRVSLNLQINGWFKIIDLSIMPPLPEPPK